MRCRLKKTIQIFTVVAFLVLYINFVFISRDSPSSLSENSNNNNHDNEQLNVKHEKGQKKNKDIDDDVLRFEVVPESLLKTSFENLSVYPSEKYYMKDRIRDQLKFIPPVIRARVQTNQKIPLKIIHVATGLGGWAVKKGQQSFLDQKCAVPHCTITDTRAKIKDADVVLFDGLVKANTQKSPNQIWLLYMLESPYHTPILRRYKGKFNWTATYRHDSTIVAPYEKFVPFNDSILTKEQPKNYAAGKTKMVAWFVSNCGARNNRMQYAVALGKHIEVDIYGRCGTLKCPRHQSSKCFDMLNKDYRFYLSFENSNCRDYITEKFFVNGLKHDVIPIVMGGAPEDYAQAAPKHSYIHVDDFSSPEELADYLRVLATNEKLYNEYFAWKDTGKLINTYFWCRVCALAHDAETRGKTWYDDVEAWWRGKDVCIGQKSWRDVGDRAKVVAPLAKYEPHPEENFNVLPPQPPRVDRLEDYQDGGGKS